MVEFTSLHESLNYKRLVGTPVLFLEFNRIGRWVKGKGPSCIGSSLTGWTDPSSIGAFKLPRPAPGLILWMDCVHCFVDSASDSERFVSGG